MIDGQINNHRFPVAGPRWRCSNMGMCHLLRQQASQPSTAATANLCSKEKRLISGPVLFWI